MFIGLAAVAISKGKGDKENSPKWGCSLTLPRWAGRLQQKWYRWKPYDLSQMTGGGLILIKKLISALREGIYIVRITKKSRTSIIMPRNSGKAHQINSDFWRNTPSSRGFRNCMVFLFQFVRLDQANIVCNQHIRGDILFPLPNFWEMIGQNLHNEP